MAVVGEVLFGRSPLVRNTLTPCVILFALLMPFLIPKWTLAALLIMIVMEAMCLASLLGFWAPAKVSLVAFRVLAGFVASLYLFFSVIVLLQCVAALINPLPAAAAPALDIFVGLVVIGGPCFWYALLGRFSLKPPSKDFWLQYQSLDFDEDDLEDENDLEDEETPYIPAREIMKDGEQSPPHSRRGEEDRSR